MGRRTGSSIVLALAVVLGGVPGIRAAGEAPGRLRVLFLGDRGHHSPADRAAQIEPVLASRGIDVKYTEDLAELNAENLANYDVLVVYANIDEAAEPRPVKAILDYVERGGGFVPLHCASYCFRNVPEYVALVGAQFARHGTGVFDTKVVDANHPITAGLTPFRTWDETYVHEKHNPDKHVLQVRDEQGKDEPWTWVRTHGKGRVFYTAYGHDERTWGDPGFHDLLERGLRWAANKGPVEDSRPRVAAGLKPFKYVPANIPLYLAGEAWGTQGKPLDRMQKPLSPEESRKHIVTPRDFTVELFAAEPEIARPICMAWDHRGRLWVAESVDYPNEKQPPGQGRDRIKICEDSDGDGRADKFTVFAEGLSIPTSLCFARGGVIVSQAPEMLLLRDTDGDDRADSREVLFTGWGVDDTHAGPSNLRWGFDNWIWGIVGYSGFRGEVGGERHTFRQGFFRFKPDGSKLEFVRSTSNNSWGVGFSEEGLVFGSTANGCPSVYLAIPNRYYEAVRGRSAGVLQSIASLNRFFPITENVRQVDHHGGFTAGAGHALYTARTYPKHYWNRTAFVAEPTGHLAATFTLHPRGTDFVAYNAWNLLASDDEWVAPIMAEVGPDGHVWVIDWYNFIVQHNPTPQGFRTGKGNAYETPLRDKTHGRIYRVVYRGPDGRGADRAIGLDPEGPDYLVKTLRHDNMTWRLHAQRLLVERGRRDVVPALVGLINDPALDEVGLDKGAIHALWTLHGLGALIGPEADPAAVASAMKALKHPSAGARRNAALVLAEVPGAGGAILQAGALSDRDPHVRLAALLSLAEQPESDAVGQALATAVLSGLAEGDRWLADAATAAAAAHVKTFLTAIGQDRSGKAAQAGPAAVAIIDRVAEHFARGGPVEDVGELLAAFQESPARVADVFVIGLERGWPKDRPAKLDPAGERALLGLIERLSTQARGPLVGLARRWGTPGLEAQVAQIAAALMESVRDESKNESDRLGGARQLVEFRAADPDVAGELLGLITPRTAPGLASGLIAALGASQAPRTGAVVADALPMLTPAQRPEALKLLLTRAEWTAALLDAIEGGKVRLTELALDQRQALAAHPDSKLADRAKALLAQGGGLPDPDRQKVIDSLSEEILKKGDPARGKVVFTEQCAKCHSHSGEGGKVGPDLTGMAAHSKAELIVHLLDPSRSVEGNFVAYTVATTDGRVLTGLLASESRTAIELYDAEGQKQTILREDIEEIAASNKSLMPEGFEKQVSVSDLRDLLEFLTSRGRFLPLDLRPVATAVSTRGMFYSSESPVERLVLSDWAPKTIEGIPFLLVDPQGDRVPNVVMLHGPQGVLPPKMPKAVSLPCNSPAKAIHLLSGISGWGFPATQRQSVSLTVRLHYADGQTEDHPLRNGVHFADYIRVVDVPGSKLALRFGGGQQVRLLTITPKRSEPIERIELLKGNDPTAPIVMGVTVDTGL